MIEGPDEFEDELSFGNPKEVKLTNLQYDKATHHVFEPQDEVQDWRELVFTEFFFFDYMYFLFYDLNAIIFW